MFSINTINPTGLNIYVKTFDDMNAVVALAETNPFAGVSALYEDIGEYEACIHGYIDETDSNANIISLEFKDEIQALVLLREFSRLCIDHRLKTLCLRDTTRSDLFQRLGFYVRDEDKQLTYWFNHINPADSYREINVHTLNVNSNKLLR